MESKPKATRCAIEGCRDGAECEVPDGDGAVSLCWRHAHAVADHEYDLATVPANHLCGCDARDIFPASWFAAAPVGVN